MKKNLMGEYTSAYNAVMKAMTAFNLSLSLSLDGFANIATMNRTYNETATFPTSDNPLTYRDDFLDYYMVH